jgi:hypothetical protein
MHGVAMFLGAAAFVVTAMLGTVWLSRARASRRFNTAVNAYAEREIDRERCRNGPPRAPDASTANDLHRVAESPEVGRDRSSGEVRPG